MNYLQMFALIIILTYCFQGYINDKSRKDHKRTIEVCDSLYAEEFSTFGQGAFGGDRIGQWLTDSTSFRIYLGVFDESSGKITIECSRDSIFVTQFPDELDVNIHLKSPQTKTYQLKELKKLNNLNNN
ncbi:MAG TPA: hypothetical protein VFW78_04320 [Bacteroidia bacterium]|nr:hypothetical protein [Bacteroidia bacterium]